VAALLVVGGWACAVSLFIVVAQRRHGGVDYGHSSRVSLALLVLSGLAMLGAAAVAVWLTDPVLSTPPENLSRTRLLVAYAGGAAGIAGTAALLLASVLVTVHRVVPQVVAPGTDVASEPVVMASTGAR
jgi:hypothetical protein